MEPAELLSHRDFVQALARSLLRDEHEAEDAAQAAWLAILRRPPDQVNSVRAWLRRCVRNVVAMDHRRRTLAARHERAGRSLEQDATDRLLEREETRRLVVAEVLALGEPLRSVIVLRYYEGRSVSQIAQALSTPSETIRSRLQRARSILRERLGRHWDRDDGTLGRALILLVTRTVRPRFAPWLLAAALTGAAALLLRHEDGASAPLPPISSDASSLSSPEPASSLALEARQFPERLREPLGVRGDALEVRVRDASGTPIGGARVSVIVDRTARARATLPLALLRLEDESDPRVLARGRTDDEGAAFVPIASGDARLAVIADAEGYALDRCTVLDRTKPVELVLGTAVHIRGQLLDEEGVPVPGAQILRTDLRQGVCLDRRALSAEDGSFEIEVSRYGRTFRGWRVDAPGFAPWTGSEGRLEGSIGERGDEPFQYFVMRRGAPGLVVVRDERTLAPLVGVDVTVTKPGYSDPLSDGIDVYPSPFRPWILARSRTDEHGEARLPLLDPTPPSQTPPQRMRAVVLTAGGEGRSSDLSFDESLGAWVAQIVVDPDDPPVPYDREAFRSLQPIVATDDTPGLSSWMEGTVVDDAGIPLEAAVITVQTVGRDSREDPQRYAYSRADGRLRMEVDLPLPWTVTAAHGGRRTTRTVKRVDESVSLVLSGELPPRTQVLTCRVVEQGSGTPIRGAKVLALANHGLHESLDEYLATLPDAANRFGWREAAPLLDLPTRQVLELEGGVEWTLFVSHPEHRTARVPLEPETTELQVPLELAPRQVGHVEVCEGLLAQDVSITVIRLDDHSQEIVPLRADGSFEFHDRGPGAHEFRLAQGAPMDGFTISGSPVRVCSESGGFGDLRLRIGPSAKLSLRVGFGQGVWDGPFDTQLRAVLRTTEGEIVRSLFLLRNNFNSFPVPAGRFEVLLLYRGQEVKRLDVNLVPGGSERLQFEDPDPEGGR